MAREASATRCGPEARSGGDDVAPARRALPLRAKRSEARLTAARRGTHNLRLHRLCRRAAFVATGGTIAAAVSPAGSRPQNSVYPRSAAGEAYRHLRRHRSRLVHAGLALAVDARPLPGQTAPRQVLARAGHANLTGTARLRLAAGVDALAAARRTSARRRNRDSRTRPCTSRPRTLACSEHVTPAHRSTQ